MGLLMMNEHKLSQGRIKEIKMLNEAAKSLHWKKKFEECEAKVIALEAKTQNMIVIESKISSARNMMQVFLKDYPLTPKIATLFKSVISVLEPDTVQSPIVTTGVTISKVQAGSSVDSGNAREQKNLNNIRVTGIKRPQVEVPVENSGNDAAQKNLEIRVTGIKRHQVEVPVENSGNAVAQKNFDNRVTGIKRRQVEVPVENSDNAAAQKNLDIRVTGIKRRQVEVPVENSGDAVAQKNLNIRVTAEKRRQVPVENEVVQGKCTRRSTTSFVLRNNSNHYYSTDKNEVTYSQPLTTSYGRPRPTMGLGSFKIDSKITRTCRTPKTSTNSSLTAAHLKTEIQSNDVVPEIQTPDPRSFRKSKVNSESKEKEIQAVKNPQAAIPVQSGTLHLKKNNNEDFDAVSSLTPKAKQAAVDLFYKSLKKNAKWDCETNAFIEKLCMLLKGDSLALKLATSYINHELLVVAGQSLKTTIENYLVKIKIVRSDCKKSKMVENPIYLAWRLTREKISEITKIGTGALEVIQIVCFLSPDNIPIQFVSDLYRSTEDQVNFAIGENIFQLLKRLSVISLDPCENSLSVQPLVQDVIRIDLKEQGTFTQILGRIRNGATKMIEDDDCDISFLEMNYVEAIWKHITKKKELTNEDGKFSSCICRKLVELGKYRESLEFSCQALAVLESTLGGDDEWTLAMKFWKGSALEGLGRYLESIELLEEVHKKQKELFGDTDGHSLDTANQIGIVYTHLKDYQNALKWYRATYQIREKENGKAHRLTLTLKNNIAMVYDEQKKYQMAAKMYEQVLEVGEQELGMDDSLMMATKYNLATVKCCQKQYEKALKMFQEVLQVQERVLEKDHPDIRNTKAWIAKCLIECP